nr:hypothetical protein [uncultured Acetatifactor sp.]
MITITEGAVKTFSTARGGKWFTGCRETVNRNRTLSAGKQKRHGGIRK